MVSHRGDRNHVMFGVAVSIVSLIQSVGRRSEKAMSGYELDVGAYEYNKAKARLSRQKLDRIILVFDFTAFARAYYRRQMKLSGAFNIRRNE